MNKLLVVVLLSFSATTFSFSQSRFQTSYGDNETDRGVATVNILSGGFCVLSNNGNPANNASEIVVYSVDNDGSLFWSAKMGTSKNDYGTDIKQTPDGGYIICGYTYGGFIDSLTSDLFLLRLDDTGFPLWSITYGGPSDDQASAVLNADDGGFYVVGNTKSFGNSATSALILRTDASGTPIWTNVNNTSIHNKYYAACLNDLHQVIAVGTAINTTSNIDQYISLIDSNGLVLWGITSGSSSEETVRGVSRSFDGGFYTVGSSQNASAGNADFNLTKRDGSGNVVWNNNYGTIQTDNATSVVEDLQHHILFTGKTNPGGLAITQNAIVITDENGLLLYSNSYGDPSVNSEGQNIILATDGRIVSTGFINSSIDPNGDTYFVKTDPTGNSGCYQLQLPLSTQNNFYSDSSGVDQQLISPIAYVTPMNWQIFTNQFSRYCFNDGINNIEERNQLTIFPNPSTGILHLKNSDNSSHLITIFNSFGQKVIQREIGLELVTLDISEWSDGIYFFQEDFNSLGKFIKTQK